YQIAEVTTPPVALTKSMPAYPEEARKQGVDMVVIVKFVVTETGDVEQIKIVDGHPTLDEAVIAALKSWKFTPGTLDGKPVRVVRKMKFPFHLRTAI
ncbi:MAG: energy transducer TonB, partial [Labilithrix sp.]|nr:energy transducer TonB [Labilithrix sp.]